MKHKKTAAVVAGSMLALGAAAPAFADEVQDPPFSVDGGLNKVMASNLLENPTIADGPLVDGVVNTVDRTARSGELKTDKNLPGGEQVGALLGGLPLR